MKRKYNWIDSTSRHFYAKERDEKNCEEYWKQRKTCLLSLFAVCAHKIQINRDKFVVGMKEETKKNLNQVKRKRIFRKFCHYEHKNNKAFGFLFFSFIVQKHTESVAVAGLAYACIQRYQVNVQN